jgi:hypothetical protein
MVHFSFFFPLDKSSESKFYKTHSGIFSPSNSQVDIPTLSTHRNTKVFHSETLCHYTNGLIKSYIPAWK